MGMMFFGYFFLVGMWLNNFYEIEEYIVDGGIGMVYWVWDVESGDFVVIKVFLVSFVWDFMIVDLFKWEVKIFKKFIYDVFI